MDEKLDLNKVKLLLNSLNSMEGLYRRKGDKDVEYYFRKAQETIWGLLDEVELYRSKEEF